MSTCFYCGEETHIVNQCVNPGILSLYENMKNVHIRTRRAQNHRINQAAFIYEIAQFNYNDIISVAIKYACAMYPISVIANDEYYMLILWHYFENLYLRNTQFIINNFVAVANVYFIDGPNTNAPNTNAPTTNAPNTNAPTTNAPNTNANTTNANTTNANTTNAPIIRRQRPLRIRTSRKKHNFITTIETEKYTRDQEEECPICLDNVKCGKFVKLNCNHKFCVRCVIKSVKMDRNIYSCALCRCKAETVRVYDFDTYDLVRQL
jgi:hypothetical protein